MSMPAVTSTPAPRPSAAPRPVETPGTQDNGEFGALVELNLGSARLPAPPLDATAEQDGDELADDISEINEPADEDALSPVFSPQLAATLAQLPGAAFAAMSLRVHVQSTGTDPTAVAEPVPAPAVAAGGQGAAVPAGEPPAVGHRVAPTDTAVETPSTGGGAQANAVGDPARGDVEGSPAPSSATSAAGAMPGLGLNAGAGPQGATAGFPRGTPPTDDGRQELTTVALDTNVVMGPAITAGPMPVAGAGNGGHGSPDLAPVTGQVFPEVVRLMSRGDGTQRITLRLSPEHLGEVRVVLTLRDGAVQVALSADAHAQEALRSGSRELHRLLEMVGASSSQIKVTALAGSTIAGTTSGFTSQDSSLQGGPTHDDFTQTGSQGADARNPEHHAETREGDTPATDGAPRWAAPLPGPTNPVTLTPHAGVDVTM